MTANAGRCKKDAVQVGDARIDTYEASVWETKDTATIKKLQKGRITGAAQIVGTIIDFHPWFSDSVVGFRCARDL